MEYTMDLKEFINRLGKPTFLDNSDFQSILTNCMEVLDLSDEDCARLFDVSRPTVTRWRNGSTAPLHAMRRFLYEVIRKEATKRLRQRQRRKSHAPVKAIA